MQENGSQNVQPTMPEEPKHSPHWTDHAKGEGPIETAGPGPSDKDPVSIPPSASLQGRPKSKPKKSGSRPRPGKGPNGRPGQGSGGRS
jgi:hypothetical protein